MDNTHNQTVTYGYSNYTDSSSETRTVGSIIGSVISALLFLVIAVIYCVFFCCRRGRSTNFTPVGSFHIFRRSPQQGAVINANTTPGVNNHQYSNTATTMAPGQTFSPPLGAPQNNNASKPPPPYAGTAPSYGQTYYTTPPYPTSPS